MNEGIVLEALADELHTFILQRIPMHWRTSVEEMKTFPRDRSDDERDTLVFLEAPFFLNEQDAEALIVQRKLPMQAEEASKALCGAMFGYRDPRWVAEFYDLHTWVDEQHGDDPGYVKTTNIDPRLSILVDVRRGPREGSRRFSVKFYGRKVECPR